MPFPRNVKKSHCCTESSQASLTKVSVSTSLRLCDFQRRSSIWRDGKRKNFEDFSHTGGAGKKEDFSKEEVEEGSMLLKQMLKGWKQKVESGDMSKQEKLQLMRDMVKGDERLMSNRFFQSVQTL